jgi:hypothetical protein
MNGGYWYNTMPTSQCGIGIFGDWGYLTPRAPCSRARAKETKKDSSSSSPLITYGGCRWAPVLEGRRLDGFLLEAQRLDCGNRVYA